MTANIRYCVIVGAVINAAWVHISLLPPHNKGPFDSPICYKADRERI